MTLTANFQHSDKKEFFKGNVQAAVARFGQLALSDLAPAELMNQAVALIHQVLPVDYCAIWDLLDNRKSMLLMTGTELGEELVPRLHIPLDPDSLEAFTLKSEFPVMIENVNEDGRFSPPILAIRQGAVCGMTVLIGTREEPYGFLEAFSQRLQPFSQDDASFLQSIANILALVKRQSRREEDLVAENQKLLKELVRAQYMTSSGHFQWDRYDIKNRLIESRERERLRLAQDLHDYPIQDLYGLIYQFNDLKDMLKEPEGKKTLDECSHTLHHVVDSLRSICRELRPPSLPTFGLEVAIRDHVEKFREQNPGIHVDLELMQDGQLLSDRLRFTLFRIYQQAMQNVSRHAQAGEVHIRFRWDDELIILEVEDDGLGFDLPRHWMDLVQEDHFGLLDIAERVESIRGKLEVLSARGEGTLVRAIIPRY
jgi:signal transduction histidine kinase